MISQMPSAAIGTVTCAGMPASPSAAPTPMKSETQIPRFATRAERVAKADQRIP